MPENSLFYLNQSRFSNKGCNKHFYGDYFILNQILEHPDPPSNIKNHDFNEREVMLYRQTYDVATGNFKGLYKTVGERIVSGNANEFF